MNIQAAKKGMMTFDIQSGSERGICELRGNIKKNKAALETDLGGPKCNIEFVATLTGVDVKSDQTEACRSFCGAFVNFDGVYKKPAAGCSTAELINTDESFKRLYEKKAYLEALLVIEPSLKNCVGTSALIENVERRNSVAITLYQLKKFDQCSKVLSPLREEAEKTNQIIAEEHMPIEAEAYISAIKTTRENLKLCADK